jgi:outer membrane receptor protein involved in Fe transport
MIKMITFNDARASLIDRVGRFFALVLSLGFLCPAVNAATEILEEVIVTATKRGDRAIMDIPISIKAIGGEVLDDFGVRSIDDIVRLDPSLQVSTIGVGNSTLIMRGVSSPGNGTVGLYFDEAVITGGNFQEEGGRTPDIGAYDIERIEVLKGPQGTVFGASSMTGTVRYITNKPDAGQFDADFSMSGFSTEHGGPGYNVNGMVNIPVVEDVLAVRAVGWQEERDGFIDHYAGLNAVTLNKDANDSEITGGRISARWTPNERFTLTAFGLAQETEVDGPQFYQTELGGPLLPIEILGGPPFFVGRIVPPLDGVVGELIVSLPADAKWDDDISLYGATLEYDLDFGNVTASVSKLEREIYTRKDSTVSGTRFGNLDVPTFFATGNLVPRGASALNLSQDREILSSEIRFSSDFDGPLNFVAGFFYEEQDTASELLVFLSDPVTGIPGCVTNADCRANPSVATSPGNGTGLGMNFNDLSILKSDSFALFGHADFELTEKLTVSGGVRYYESDQRDTLLTLQPLSFIATTPANGGAFLEVPILEHANKVEFDETTFDAGLSYAHNDDQLYYFRAASGFRQGGINGIASLADAFGIVAPETFEPDSVLSLEVGAKTSWFNNRLSVVAAYYRMFWDDIWVPGEEPTGTFEFIANAAKAEIDGVDLEIHARPTDQWYLNFGLNWLNGQLTADQTFFPGLLDRYAALGLPPPPAGRDGDTLPRTPEWSFSGMAEYTFPFPLIADAEAKIAANLSYKDSAVSFFNDDFVGFTEFGDYFLLDLNAKVSYKNWDYTLFIQNVTDKLAEVDVFSDPGGSINTFTVRPRTIGLTLKWSYR